MKYTFTILFALLLVLACSKPDINPIEPTPVPSPIPTVVPSPTPDPNIPEGYSTGYLGGENPLYPNAPFESPALLEAYPIRFDWRKLDGETEVRNQGNCGSCWAFGSVQMLVGAIKIFDGKDVRLSEQELVSCDNNSHGCSGGWASLEYLQNPGLALDSDFPYTASNQKCKSGLKHDYKAIDARNIGERGRKPTVVEIKAALLQYGFIEATVAANNTWSSYKGGVKKTCGAKNTNHIVTIVGYNETTKSWIVKNSWGTSWGDKGYIELPYGCDSIGNQAAFVVYKPGVMAYKK